MREPVSVDSVAFARDGREIAGRVEAADMHRLHDVLHERSGEIRYRLAGSMDKDGVASLRLRLDADLALVCQRCLGPVAFRLESERRFDLVPAGKPLGDPAEEPDDVERIHADPALDVASLVEDEAILTLPMVAVHAEGECAAPATAADESGKLSAFSALGALKRQ